MSEAGQRKTSGLDLGVAASAPARFALDYIRNGYIQDRMSKVRTPGAADAGRVSHSAGPRRSRATRLRHHATGQVGLPGRRQNGAGNVVRLAGPHDRRRSGDAGQHAGPAQNLLQAHNVRDWRRSERKRSACRILPLSRAASWGPRDAMARIRKHPVSFSGGVRVPLETICAGFPGTASCGNAPELRRP